MRQARDNAGRIVMEWISIPRQLKLLAWTLIALGFAYLAIRLLSECRR
jgi:hypothetical protein